MMHLPPEGYCNATRVHLDRRRWSSARRRRSKREAARTAVGEVLLMNGVDHVEPHPVIPDAGAAARPTRSARRCATRRCPRMSTPSAPACNATASAESLEVIRRRAARRRGLRQPAARRVLGARLHQAGQRARADAAREARRAAGDVRVDAGRALPGRRAALRVEDAAAEPSARQHLRLQHRRRARGEHDAVRARRAGRARGGGRGRGGDRARRAGRPERRRCDSSPSTPPAQPFSGVIEADRRSAVSRAPSRGALVDPEALDAPVALLAGRRAGHRRARADRPARAAVPDARRRRRRHVRDEPLRHAVGAARAPRCGCCCTATCPRAATPRSTSDARPSRSRRGRTAAGRRPQPAQRTHRGERLRARLHQRRRHRRRRGSSGPARATRGAASSKTSATSATNTTTRRRAADRRITSADARRRPHHAGARTGPIRAGIPHRAHPAAAGRGHRRPHARAVRDRADAGHHGRLARRGFAARGVADHRRQPRAAITACACCFPWAPSRSPRCAPKPRSAWSRRPARRESPGRGARRECP